MKIEKWHAIVAFFAALFLLITLVIDHNISGNDLLSSHTAAIFFTDIGFALIISLVISFGIEQRVKEIERLQHEKMKRDIAEDVFKGVFSEILPRSYINSVITDMLKVSSIRNSMTINELIKEIDKSFEGTTPSVRKKYIQIERNVEYHLESVNGRNSSEIGIFFGPVNNSELERFSKITRMSINGTDVEHSVLESYRSVIRDGTTVEYKWPIQFDFDSIAHVSYEATLFKERSDSDYWSTVFPTMKFNLTVKSDISLSRLGFLERTSAKVSTRLVDTKRGLISMTIDGPMLPNDLIAYWWST